MEYFIVVGVDNQEVVNLDNNSKKLAGFSSPPLSPTSPLSQLTSRGKGRGVLVKHWNSLYFSPPLVSQPLDLENQPPVASPP